MAHPQRRIPIAGQSRLRLRQPVPAEEPPAPSKGRWWRKPLGWFTEEAFWRDITKSTVSTGVVALIVYLYAIGAGYVRSPSGWQAIVGVVNVAAGPAFGALLLWGFFYNPDKHRHRPRWVQRTLYMLVVLLAIFAGLTMIDSTSIQIPFWPFTTEPFTLRFKDGTSF